MAKRPASPPKQDRYLTRENALHYSTGLVVGLLAGVGVGLAISMFI